MGPTYEEIKAILNTPGSTLKSVQNPFEKYSQGTWIQDPTVVKPVKYDVPMDAIYDRLSDGSYIRKYDNYLGATGNEDRLGREQSTGEQWGHGLAKMGAKTLNYALDATVGTIYGIGQAINDGKFDSFWNNDFSNKLDDWNKTLDNNLANYYTDEQKSMGVLRKLGTANFWANDFAGGLAFVGGALLPELALGALTGGATFAGSAAKFGFKTGLKSAMKVAGRELAEEAFDPTNYLSKAKGLTGKQTFNAVEAAKSAKALDGGLDLLKATTRAKYYGTAGSIADTGLFLTRTSAFEAGMEARQNFKESIQNYTDKYIEKNGKAPSADELSKFTQAAASGANAVFGANMAILSVSNAAMFGKTFNIKGIQKIGNKLEGLENRVLGITTKKEIVDGVSRTVLKDATKGQKLIGNAYKLLGKASVEGLYEEGFQGVAGKTMQNYLENKYVNNNESYGYLASLSDAFKEQYTTNEGWTEMMVGMLIGSTAGVFTNPLSKVAGKLSGQEVDTGGFLGSIPGLGKNSRKAAHLAMKEKVDTINKGVDNLRSMNRASSAKSFRDQMDSGNTSTMGMEEALLNRDFIKSQDSLKTPTQILEDFTAVIEHSDFNENGIADTIGEENVPAYKQKLITDFKTSLENHKRASSAVESLNLGKRLSDTTLGNQIELEDHIETMLYLGLDSKQKAASTARELDDLIGSEGLYDAMEFFNGISNENKEKVQELNNKKRELGQAKKLAEKYGLEMTGLRQTRRTSAQSEAKYNQTAEKAALAAEKILSLESDIENLGNVLAEKVDPNILNRVGGDIASNLDKIEQLDKYEDALRKSGRTAEADAVAYKILQYKMHSDMSRESATFFSKMVEQDFFNTKVGKKYKDEVIGTPYKMNKELEDLIANNDALIDNALSSRGITAVNRTEAMKALIDGNDQLSEREKAKVASLYRILLTATNLNRIKDEIQDGIVRVSAEESNGIDGDSIEVAEKININQDDLGTLSLLNEAIDKILSQVEFIRGNTKAAEQVEKLEKQLENLRQQKAELEAQLKAEGGTVVKGIKATSLKPGDKFRYLGKNGVQTYTVKEVVENIGSVESIKTEEGETFINPKAFSRSGELSDWEVTPAPQTTQAQPTPQTDIEAKIAEIEAKIEALDKTIENEFEEGDYVKVLALAEKQVKDGTIPQTPKNTQLLTNYPKLFEEFIKATDARNKTVSEFDKEKVLVGTPNELPIYGIQSSINTATGGLDIKWVEVRKEPISNIQLTKIGNYAASELINYKNTLQAEKAGLEQQLKTEQNATKESTEQEENSNEQSSSSQYSGTDTRQQTTGQTEGEQRDTEEQSTDSSNSTIASQIQEIDQKIAEIEAKIQTVKSTKFKIVESEDWKRLDELTKKGTLTDQEKEELDILKGEIDNWTLLTGVVADGFRLSDLLIQKNLLENTAIKNTNEPEEVSVEELISGLDLGDTAKGSGYNYSLFYYSVQAFRDKKTGLISVSGITAENLFEEMGVKFAKLGDSSYKIVINGEAFTVLISDQKKNIQFTDEAIESINANTNVSIAPTNKDIPTGYSILYKFPAGQAEGELLQSDFNKSFVEEPSADAVYATRTGDEVFFVIDPRDKHNKELLAPYKKEEEPIDTDKVDEAIVSLYEQKLASDSNLIELEKQLADAQAERDLATKPSDKSKASRRVTSLENRITKRQDKLLKDSTEDVEKINKKAAKAAKGKKDLKAIKESLVIHVVNKKGERLQTLKGKNKNGVSSTESDMIFEGLRDMIGSDEDLIQRLAGIPEPISLDLVGTKVEKVLLGHPNLNIIKNEDGSHSVVYKSITTNKNVVDIGFIENGVLKLRGSKEGVNTYYTKKFEDKKSKQRIPVIVFEKAGRKIAYPAKVAESEVKTHEEFENIYNADILDSVKVVALNKYLAANGIDINGKGNAFILAGKSNLNDTFFQNKLAQLNNLKYFYDLDAWLDSKNDLDNILKTQVMVNINLSNPIHSPKLKLDFTGLPIEIKTNVKNNTNSNMTRLFGVSNTSSAKSAKKNANSNLNEPC
jgi:hypothetical protein